MCVFFIFTESKDSVSNDGTEETTGENSSGPKGLLTTGATNKKKKKKKNVTWHTEDKLRIYHYFELDENERGIIVK